jgi:serine/threonine protein kinase
MIGSIYFGKYRIIKQIGKGGMSQVFLAKNIKLGNKLAIKRVNKKNNAINLLVEPSILKDLNHPLIPHIVDIEEDREYLYIIEEYIEGVNLAVYKNINKNIDEEMIVNTAIQMCDVLEYLHSRKPYPIIYRDMKPENIIMSDEDTIKFVDFGIARQFKHNNDTDTVLIGTKGYCAPEQYVSECQSDTRTDIYSLGVTLYYLATGKNLSSPPYNLVPIRELNNNYSSELEKIIIKCTHNNPENRFQSAKDIKEELLEIIDTPKTMNNTTYSVIKQKTIGVISLTKRAGATFFATNLAIALSGKNIITSLIELPYEEPYIYDMVGISNYNKEYYSILNEIDNENPIHREKITKIKNILYLVIDPTKRKIASWDDNKSMKIIYSAKESLISIIDIGNNYFNVENILDEFDLLYVIYDAMPPDLMANYSLHEKIYKYNEASKKVRFVLNKDNKGINKKTLNKYLGIKPNITIPDMPLELIYKAIYNKKYPYEEPKLKNTFDICFSDIYRELLPKGFNNNKKKRSFLKRH